MPHNFLVNLILLSGNHYAKESYHLDLKGIVPRELNPIRP